MKSTCIFILLAVVASSGASAQDTPPQDVPHDFYLMAVGDIPVPELEVVTEQGITGYRPKELPAEVVFPQVWQLDAGKGVTELTLNLNRGALKLSMAAKPETFSLRPLNCLGQAPGAARALAPVTGSDRTLMVVYNRARKIDWMKNYDFVVTSLEEAAPGRPAAKIVNISGVSLHYLDLSGNEAVLNPGSAAVGLAQVHPNTKVGSLPLYAQTGGQRHDLRVTPLEVTGGLLPVVAIYPGYLQHAPNALPFKTSVILPHTAAATRWRGIEGKESP